MNARGDAGWDELQKTAGEEVDAALSLLGDAQIELALEFNKPFRILKGGKLVTAPGMVCTTGFPRTTPAGPGTEACSARGTAETPGKTCTHPQPRSCPAHGSPCPCACPAAAPVPVCQSGSAGSPGTPHAGPPAG